MRAGDDDSLADEGTAEEVDAVQLREHPRHHVSRRPQRRCRCTPVVLLPLSPRRCHGRSLRPVLGLAARLQAQAPDLPLLPAYLLVPFAPAQSIWPLVSAGRRGWIEFLDWIIALYHGS
jgi:hypothetical protein